MQKTSPRWATLLSSGSVDSDPAQPPWQRVSIPDSRQPHSFGGPAGHGCPELRGREAGEFSEPRTATPLPVKRTVLEDRASSGNRGDWDTAATRSAFQDGVPSCGRTPTLPETRCRSQHVTIGQRANGSHARSSGNGRKCTKRTDVRGQPPSADPCYNSWSSTP